jgi:hypothetical protein
MGWMVLDRLEPVPSGKIEGELEVIRDYSSGDLVQTFRSDSQTLTNFVGRFLFSVHQELEESCEQKLRRIAEDRDTSVELELMADLLQ